VVDASQVGNSLSLSRNKREREMPFFFFYCPTLHTGQTQPKWVSFFFSNGKNLNEKDTDNNSTTTQKGKKR
jgi:hypothetical protein